ncbi:DEAD/DEAH box helicase [Pseudomonas sp. MCal1]|uniref:DEAD/DEAH box helicase n=1 Tax=Pseudomonas TaxID=286 RepID=UPI001F3BBC72|nr:MULTISPECIES: DEAD/DEAH box helicase [Pseudomonas]MCX4219845.1 DEAD/DEAH box helicase [Pseudomonas sp. MCal1]UIN55146.1 DEAD/DEAH box helicase [Pseudomonas kribbensis]
MKKTQWIRQENQIALRLPCGETVEPTALEIFQIVFQGITHYKSYEVENPKLHLPDVTFSKIPAEVTLCISSESNIIKSELGVSSTSEFIAISTDSDQAIINSTWHPIHKSQFHTALAWLSSKNININSGLNIASLIDIRISEDQPFKVIDTVSEKDFTPTYDGAHAIAIDGLNAKLYEYQAIGVLHLQKNSQQGVGCVLADEMGLGKTLQIIALLQQEKNSLRGPSLIIAPATLIENWAREITQFAPNLEIQKHIGSDRAGITKKLGLCDITITSYETAIKDEILLASINWNIITLDEAQNIKNPHAQRTLAIKRLPCRVPIAVTGTPFENKLEDLWSICDFVLPGLLGDLDQFNIRFSDSAYGAENIAPIIAPLILRRMVSEVADDLPNKIDIPQALPMSTLLANKYEVIRTEILAEYGAAAGLVATSKLRMFCANPSMHPDWLVEPIQETPKYIRLIEILSEIFSRNEKALIFSTYQSVADLFIENLPKNFPTNFFRKIDGRTLVMERQLIVDEFFNFEGTGALFLNPKAAGSGLNITAANHVIHFNPEWNPALTAQASARAYRRKQKKPVTIHHLYYADTVEEVIRNTSLSKQTLAGQAVTGHQGEIEPIVIADALNISPINSKN